MLEKTTHLVLLFDFYGELLTDRQKDIFKLYYYEDLSLGEISDLEKISRQGVYDLLQRGEELLTEYEHKLGLVKNFTLRQNKLKKLKKMLELPENERSHKECLDILDELIRGDDNAI
ncbi:YlxM family DNA-binding protein [Natranaerobius trueperi]|uniref:UPF0122 protein CDO51_04845 n=1 Tax=Natranaerobius trueperi TaxID=759412 RepID=A0A226BZI0_9FIRM|nr:YlxM family DNA-binding protein [Natranaerobius trueperi]OWZ84202.1 DNA-binding protein [Natranaerobius trueperi]